VPARNGTAVGRTLGAAVGTTISTTICTAIRATVSTAVVLARNGAAVGRTLGATVGPTVVLARHTAGATVSGAFHRSCAGGHNVVVAQAHRHSSRVGGALLTPRVAGPIIDPRPR